MRFHKYVLEYWPYIRWVKTFEKLPHTRQLKSFGLGKFLETMMEYLIEGQRECNLVQKYE